MKGRAVRRQDWQGRSPGNGCEIRSDNWQVIAEQSWAVAAWQNTLHTDNALNSFLCLCLPSGLVSLAVPCSPGIALSFHKQIVLKESWITMTTFFSACLCRASSFRRALGRATREEGDRAMGSIDSPGQIPGARPTAKRLILTWHLMSLFFATHKVREWPWP